MYPRASDQNTASAAVSWASNVTWNPCAILLPALRPSCCLRDGHPAACATNGIEESPSEATTDRNRVCGD